MKSFQTTEKKPLFPQLFLSMKLTVLLILIFSLNASADGFSQQKINLKLKKTEISSILSSIEKQTNYRFLYNTQLTDLQQKIDVSVEDADLKQVLDQVFANTYLSYELMQNNLVVIKKADEGVDEIKTMVSGTVTGENNSKDGDRIDPYP